MKAYLRRAAARLPLGRLSEACEDYSRVLKLEPNNKHAQLELAKIHKVGWWWWFVVVVVVELPPTPEDDIRSAGAVCGSRTSQSQLLHVCILY